MSKRRILDQFGQPVQVQRANYDAASNSRLLDFTNAADIGANEALRPELATIRKRTRFEMRNNGIAKGIGRTYANVAVGRGPRLKVRSADRAWAQTVEMAFARWGKRCGYRLGESLGQLTHLGFKQFFPCGEYFLVPRIDEAAASPVKLRYLMIRPDRVFSPAGVPGDGVDADRDGRPRSYWVLRDDPDNQGSGYYGAQEFYQVPADLMIHVFVEEDPIQFRAEPWLAVALTVFHKLRRLDEGTLSAAEIANKFAAFLKNTIPEMAVNAEILLPTTADLEDGTLTTLPPGYEPVSMKPEHPNTNVGEFRRDQLAAAGRGACLPVNAVTGDSSKHNFASARFDGLMLLADTEHVRGIAETRQLDKMFSAWLAESTRVGEVSYPPGPFVTQWLWQKNEAHTNPVDGAKAVQQRLANGVTTVADEVLLDGRDDDDHEARLFAEIARFQERGLSHPYVKANAAALAAPEGGPSGGAADGNSEGAVDV